VLPGPRQGDLPGERPSFAAMLWLAQASESNSVPLEAVAITAGAVVLAAVIAAVAAHL
jgi:hypothetical protein